MVRRRNINSHNFYKCFKTEMASMILPHYTYVTMLRTYTFSEKALKWNCFNEVWCKHPHLIFYFPFLLILLIFLFCISSHPINHSVSSNFTSTLDLWHNHMKIYTEVKHKFSVFLGPGFMGKCNSRNVCIVLFSSLSF